MADTTLVLKAWNTAYFELGEAFKGLPDADVWRRASPCLLSVGEVAAHCAYWENRKVNGGQVVSTLADAAALYYTTNRDTPFSLDLGAEAVLAELHRIHEASMASTAGRDSDEPNPHDPGLTWGQTVEYQVFHISYHTGQIYSVRHLLGHETVDN